MDYVEQWYQSLVKSGSHASPLRREAEAWGEYRKHTGPAVRYARVKIALGPSDAFEVIDRLTEGKSALLKQEGCFDQIAFGVLDVMMTALPTPVQAFRLVILDADYDAVTSVPIAFRLAAREAIRTILEEQAANL